MKLIFPLLFMAGFAAETLSLSKYSDPGTCVCDLTYNSCDEFCCCDADCSSSLISSWQDLCLPSRFSTFGSKYCISDSEVYKINSRRGMDEISSNDTEFCIQIDNSEKISEFHQTAPTPVSSEVKKRSSDGTTYTHSLIFLPKTSTSSYSADDPLQNILILTSNSFGGCIQSKVGFMINIEESICSTTSYLSSSCLENFNVANFSKNFDKTLIYRNPTTGADSSLTAATTVFSNNICNFALIEAQYTIITDQIKVTKIKVKLIVTNLSSDSLIKVSQKFSVKFYTSETYTEHSGNPGYLIGKPLLAGFTNNTKGVLTVKGKNNAGACDNSNSLSTTVGFGVNFVHSCYQEFNYAQLQSFCGSSFNVSNIGMFKTLSNLESIGKWGLSDVNNTDDWIKIDAFNQLSTNFSNGECVLSNNLVYDIYYAYIGSVRNPQPKVVYAKKYYKQGTWRYNSIYNTDAQRFAMNVVFNFIPYDSSYDPYHTKPRRDTIMPQDVLDPFRTSYSKVLLVSLFVLVEFI